MAEHTTTTLRDDAFERPRRPAVDLARILPSGRSLLVGFVLLAGGILSYVVARQTSAFALRAVEVRGAPPSLERQVQTALGSLHGQVGDAGAPVL